MRKAFLPLFLAAAMTATVFTAAGAQAQAPTLPAEPNIVDPRGDGNGLNDQGFNTSPACVGANCVPGIGDRGDTTTPASVGAGDILAVWFTETSDTVSVHFQSALPPPNSAFSILYRVRFNPVPIETNINGPNGCVWIEGAVKGNTFQSDSFARLRFVCAGTPNVDVEPPVVATLDNGTGVTTIVIPKSAAPEFADGATIAAPRAEARGVIGGTVPVANVRQFATVPQFDNTKPGKDYVIGAGGAGECPGEDGGKPTARPTGTAAPTTPGTAPGVAVALQTPTPATTATGGGDDDSCPKEKKRCPKGKKGKKGKKKKCPKPKPRPKPRPTTTSTPTPAPTQS